MNGLESAPYTKPKPKPKAMAVRYDRRICRVVIALESGLEIAFAPRDVQGLENAQPADLVDAEISPSGLGGKTGGKALSEGKASAAHANGRLGGRPRKIKEMALVDFT